ncbi:MAG: hypothetical protein K9W44_02005 [Candidatus Lokiarchaeota archaeon]|nr:hypothetical protein [Candidatus Harpocratesius repetitus]
MIFEIPFHSRIHPVIVAVKLFVLVFYLFSAYKVYKKQNSTLNKCFATSFVAWAGFNFFDIIVLYIAPLSYTAFIIAQVFWRIQLLMLFILTYFTYNTACIVQSSLYIMKEKKQLLLQISILAISYIILAIFSNISIQYASGAPLNPVTDLPPNDDFVVKDVFGVFAVIFVVPLSFYLIASFRLGTIAKSLKNKELKRKVIYTIIGNLLIPIGLIYFLIRDLIWEATILNTAIGQVVFVFSPIFIFLSQRSKST